MFLVNFDHFIDQQEWITMRNKLAYTVDIYDRINIGIVDRSLNFSVLHLATDHTRKLVIDSMAGTHGDYTSFYRTAYEGKISHTRGLGFI